MYSHTAPKTKDKQQDICTRRSNIHPCRYLNNVNVCQAATVTATSNDVQSLQGQPQLEMTHTLALDLPNLPLKDVSIQALIQLCSFPVHTKKKILSVPQTEGAEIQTAWWRPTLSFALNHPLVLVLVWSLHVHLTERNRAGLKTSIYIVWGDYSITQKSNKKVRKVRECLAWSG